MTTEPRDPINTPKMRFLRAVQGSLQLWLWLIGIGLALSLIGILPTVFSVIAICGLVWIPIVVLSFWGQLLDETMNLRSDIEEEPW